MSGTFVLYRFFDADDVLLYIGQTVSPPDRFRDHSHKEWWETVARIDIETFPDAQTLSHAEKHAIIFENPVHNITYNTPPLPKVSNAKKRETLEHFGWICISNRGSGTFYKPDRPSAFHTRAAAWTQLQR